MNSNELKRNQKTKTPSLNLAISLLSNLFFNFSETFFHLVKQ